MCYLKKFFKHFKLVCKHKWYVFLACCEAGIPWRGIKHDMSKFSPIEFLNSVKYYTGDRSPIDNEKDDKGYSYAWLHHRGRNPHHWEYWIDNLSSGGHALKMPYNCVKEMVCDWIGSGKAYLGKRWSREETYNFFMKKKRNDDIKLNVYTEKFIRTILYLYATSNNYTIGEIFNNFDEYSYNHPSIDDDNFIVFYSKTSRENTKGLL